MLQQRLIYRIGEDEPGFDLEQATRAPVPEQVVPPVVNAERLDEATSWRLLLQVAGNVVAGSALLGLLLAAPAFLGIIFGL